MKILNLEGSYFVPSFRRLGHEVVSIGYDEGHDLVLTQPLDLPDLWAFLESRNFWPELVLWCDLCRPPAVIGFERLPALTVGYSIDQYCNPWHVPYSAAFDLMLVAQRDYLHLFMADNFPRRVAWLPLFCSPEVDRDLHLHRDIPVSFVGTLDPPLNPQRPRFLEEFQAYQQLYLDQGDYVPVFCRSQLVLNQSVVGELNFRLFQAMACGAAVLTEDVFNGLKSLFMPEEEVFIYPQNNARAAARQAQQALADPVRLQAVARAGRRKTLKEHTATVRAKKILSLAQELAGSGLRQFRLQSQAIIREHLAQTFFFLATDEQLAIPAEMRQVYLDIGLSYRA